MNQTFLLMRRATLCAITLLLFSALFTLQLIAQEPAAPATAAELKQRLEAHVSQAKFSAAIWGVKIVSADTGKVVFEHNSQKLMSPASNSKLYTVALALDRLGPDYRIKTSLLSEAIPNRWGTLHGDLVVYGRGDPTINGRLHHENILEALEPLVAALTNAGVRKITGDLIADETFIKGPPYGSGWAWDDMEYYYGAEISALTINDNVLTAAVKPGAHPGQPCAITRSPATTYLVVSNRTTTVASGKRDIKFFRPLEKNVLYVSGQMPAGDAGMTEEVTVHQPAGLFIQFFKEALARHGIKVRGKLRVRSWNDPKPQGRDTLRELASIESPPLSDIAREIMKPSQNLYTDLLLAHVAETTRGSNTTDSTSEDLGIRELGKFLSEAGVQPGDVLFEEGSGLSRNNLTTPNATVTLLSFMNRHKAGNVFLDALPIAGVDGTLRNRMKGTVAAGNVRAKTGTLRWANSLSGHVTTAAGEHLIFSIMLNRYHNTDANRTGRAEIDYIPTLLAEFKGRATE
jgi:D-alanyl-D-alanine carboxypeptidase/D-alanyl-D-alanine-endopeptidase (penicillin-binding protein 4)